MLRLVCLLAGAFVCVAASAQTVGFATLSPGSILHAQASVIAKVVQDHSKLQVRVIGYGGDAIILPSVNSKKDDFWILDVGESADAMHGRGSFKGNPQKNLRTAITMYGFQMAFWVRKDSSMQTIADLKGKRVATPFASTAHYSLLAALAQNDLSPADVQLIDLQPQAILAAWDRGDIAAAYTWLPTLDQLRKTGKDLITSRQLAKDGKPTLDLGAVSDDFANAHPDVVDTWRQQEARALKLIHDDPAAAAKAIAAEIGLSPAEVEGQLKQGVYLTPEQVASPEWLGSEGKPGNIAVNLQSASQFLADQKQIPSAASLQTFQDAIYTKGLPGAITQ